jgi:hypothetical protein
MEEKQEKTETPEDREVRIVDVVATGEKKLDFTTSFTVDWEDPETGKKLSGTFTATRPTLGLVGQIAVIKARLNGGEDNINPQVDFMNEMIAYLQVTLIDTPTWWKPSAFFSVTPIQSVWDWVRKWQDSFRNRRVG